MTGDNPEEIRMRPKPGKGQEKCRRAGRIDKDPEDS